MKNSKKSLVLLFLMVFYSHLSFASGVGNTTGSTSSGSSGSSSSSTITSSTSGIGTIGGSASTSSRFVGVNGQSFSEDAFRALHWLSVELTNPASRLFAAQTNSVLVASHFPEGTFTDRTILPRLTPYLERRSLLRMEDRATHIVSSSIDPGLRFVEVNLSPEQNRCLLLALGFQNHGEARDRLIQSLFTDEFEQVRRISLPEVFQGIILGSPSLSSDPILAEIGRVSLQNPDEAFIQLLSYSYDDSFRMSLFNFIEEAFQDSTSLEMIRNVSNGQEIPNQTGLIDALASLQGLSLRAWSSGASGQLELAHRFDSSNAASPNIIHVRNVVRRNSAEQQINHFHLLLPIQD